MNMPMPPGTNGKPNMIISFSFSKENFNLVWRKVIKSKEELLRIFVISILNSMPVTPILKATRNKILKVRYDIKVPMDMVEKINDCFFARSKLSDTDARV